MPYDEWKSALADEFILPNIRPEMAVVEIAAGHGRWSEIMLPLCDQAVIRAYLLEICRVLRHCGRAAIHHAGRNHHWLWLGQLRHRATFLRNLYARISMGAWYGDDGWRSNVSPDLVKGLAEDIGLAVVSQTREWGAGGRYGVKRYNDAVSTLQRGG